MKVEYSDGNQVRNNQKYVYPLMSWYDYTCTFSRISRIIGKNKTSFADSFNNCRSKIIFTIKLYIMKWSLKGKYQHMIKNCQEVFVNKANLSSYHEEHRPIKPTYYHNIKYQPNWITPTYK